MISRAHTYQILENLAILNWSLAADRTCQAIIREVPSLSSQTGPKPIGKRSAEKKERNNNVMPEQLYGKENEVSKAISVPVRTLQGDRYYKRGIPFIKKGRSVFYLWSDVYQYMERNKIKTVRN